MWQWGCCVSAIWAVGFAIDSSEGCVFRLDCGCSSLLDRLLSQSVPWLEVNSIITTRHQPVTLSGLAVRRHTTRPNSYPSVSPSGSCCPLSTTSNAAHRPTASPLANPSSASPKLLQITSKTSFSSQVHMHSLAKSCTNSYFLLLQTHRGVHYPFNPPPPLSAFGHFPNISPCA